MNAPQVRAACKVCPAPLRGKVSAPADFPCRVRAGKCLETSTDFALKPAHVPRRLNIRDPLSENVASEADHGARQL